MNNKKLFLFDIDGTLAVEEDLYDGTREMLAYIEEIGGKACFITNNSTKSNRDYVEKFKKWGFDTQEDQFVTAGYMTTKYLLENFRDEKIFVVGTASFVEELRRNGLNVVLTPDQDVACVLVAFDNELTYEKTAFASQLLHDPNRVYLATNPDLRCPSKAGFIPDCGAICAMIGAAVDRAPLYLGKPNKGVVELCLEATGYTKEETLVVGDRLYTDIACGIEAGVDTCAVLTGETTRDEIAESRWKPELVLETIKDLYQYFR